MMAGCNHQRNPMTKVLAAQFRVAPGKRVQLAKVDPRDAAAFPDREKAEAQSKKDGEASTRCRTSCSRKAIARCWSCCKAPTRRARTAPSATCSTRPGRWASRSRVPPAERGRAGARFSVARASRLPAPRHHRHFQPLPLRGRAGGARAQAGAAPKDIEQRYEQINAFEKMLTENGTTILKFMLHISKDEQARASAGPPRRAQQQLEVQSRRPGGPQALGRLPGGLRGDAATLLDRLAVARDPGRPQWARNAAIAGIVRETLEAMNPHIPSRTWIPERFQR